MAKQKVNIGSSVNKGDGDPLRTAFKKINENFDELYASTTTDLTALGSSIIPDTNGTRALGSSTNQWSDLFVRDFIYIGGTRLQSDAAGNITVDGGSLQIKDVQGDIFADDSTKVFDSSTQTFTGKFEGELIGTVAADDSTVLIDGVAGTINAGALTGNLPAIDGSALTGITASSIAFSNITSRPTTISGYGITDAYTKTEVDSAITSSVLPSGSAQSIDVVAADSTVLVDSVNGTLNATTLTGALPAIDGSALTGVTTAFSNITSKPTTLAGYGITDAATLSNMAPTGAVDFTGATVNGLTVTETDPIVGAITGIVKADGSGNISAAVAGTDYLTTVAFSDLTGKPTTLAGYGITDAAGTSSATTFTADVKFDQGVTESFATYNNVSGVVAMDCDHGHLFYVTNATGDITTNLTNFGLTAEYGTNVTIIIDQGNTPYEVTAVQIGGAAQTIVWQGNSAPTGTANGVDSFSFTILNDGGTYVVLGQMVAFGGV